METKIKSKKTVTFLFMPCLILLLIFFGTGSCSNDDESEPDLTPTGTVEVTTFAEGATFNAPSGIKIDAQGTLLLLMQPIIKYGR